MRVCVCKLEIRAPPAGRGRISAGDLSVTLTWDPGGSWCSSSESVHAEAVVLPPFNRVGQRVLILPSPARLAGRWASAGLGWWRPLPPRLLLHDDDERFVAFAPRGGGSVFWVGFLPMVSPTCCCVSLCLESAVLLSAVAVASSLAWHAVGVAWIILDVPSVIADFTVLPASPCPRAPGTEPLASARLSAG